MTVKELCEKCGFTVCTLPEPDREVKGAYIGDLLSWVMGRASAGNVWITIMSNINVVAVSTLADTSCVVVAEGVTLDDEVVKVATEKEINILYSSLPSFETAVKISGLV